MKNILWKLYLKKQNISLLCVVVTTSLLLFQYVHKNTIYLYILNLLHIKRTTIYEISTKTLINAFFQYLYIQVHLLPKYINN